MRKKKLLTYIIMILSLVTAGKMARDIYRLWHTEDRLTEAQRELIKEQEEKQQLEQELSQVEGQEWWERQVRDKLLMARPEETVVVVPEGVTVLAESKEKAGGSQVKEDVETKPWQKWWQLFMIEY